MLKPTLLASVAAGLVAAQLPPVPEGVTVIPSKFHEGVKISFKQPGICETTPGVQSYAGHVHLPPGYLNDAIREDQDYPINTFFWFFEARNDPHNAPLAIWLNGGPGGSSMMGLLQENGPCMINADSKTTSLNPWSWNNHVNMLYIDEPTQVGFSFDLPTNGTIDLTGREPIVTPTDFDDVVPKGNLTTLVGTFPSQNLTHTANSTQQAAHAMWHFAQAFFSEFPYYKPNDDRISIWAESYGGHYGPGFFKFFQEQNERIANGTIDDEHAHYLHLDTLGIVNGLLDTVLQTEAWISYPYNNTYGIEIFNQSFHDELMHNYTRPHGCRDQGRECQDRLKKHVANRQPGMAISADLCEIDEWCADPATDAYLALDHSWVDIAHPHNDPFPPPYMHGYLTQESVLAALGSPINWTSSSGAVSQSFQETYDVISGGFLDAVAYLLDSGVKVHMMYGDRDYVCNWVGGQAASLAIPYSGADKFAHAGYAPLVTEEGTKGLTRQFGNYSFTRVFDAGHEVPSYQPLAAYEIFMRATFSKDIATGKQDVTDDLTTKGPLDTWHIKNKVPVRPKPKCYVLDRGRCLPEVWERVVAGNVTVKDFFVVDDKDDAVEDEGWQPVDEL